ncbi:MAG: type III-A CRISPR-associated protein Cas10/Csm1 [Bryobacterales bacterium]|nr:type III-A CRISPR-associated protein Cas10/Csm1 [Bryobacteraceae bacterium]MDW8355783.1 type III-A CRISPR-associated protein Cas10/Csm1 [Bryobacterales bacterium]
MNDKQMPTCEETVLGVFLHDIGKFFQRADFALPAHVRELDSTILPKDPQSGRYTHQHVLWTDFFFDELGWDREAPPGVRWRQVRHVAVFHHAPDNGKAEIGAVAWIAAEADRLSAGMDRKPRDEEEEQKRSRPDYARTPLVSPFQGVQLEATLGTAPDSFVPLEELSAEEAAVPRPKLDTSDYPVRYRRLAERFREEFEALLALPGAAFDVFAEALHSLSERYLHAVPSSVKDQPDISLHDHSRAAAAVAAALYRFHEREGSLDEAAAIRDRRRPKFRFLSGDLSGIQSSLFRLASEQVAGVNRILRARSFVLGMLVEGAALLCRRALDLPPFSILATAGGQFLMLVADVPGLEERVEAVRKHIEDWLFQRYRGELALNLSLTEPFAGEALMREQFMALQERISRAREEAKLRAFSTCLRAVHRDARYPAGVCKACGVRPAAHEEQREDASSVWRCEVCEEERQLGSVLPRAQAMAWSDQPDPPPSPFQPIRLYHKLWLVLYEEAPSHARPFVSACRFEARGQPYALRHVANYVPRLAAGETDKAAYRLLSEEGRQTEPGDVKTFEHLALDALEAVDGQLLGEAMLAVLKADVDRLGMIFSMGSQTPSLGRLAALSRMLDFFFTARLMRVLRQNYPSTYTVYAGGDDLLLIGPWRQMTALADTLESEFRRWTGNNPHITISAALELIKPDRPLNRAAAAAEERLERAKDAGRSRICAFSPAPVEWAEYRRQLERAEKLNDWLRRQWLSLAFAYRVLAFDDERCQVERDGAARLNLRAASWRARWAYQLARNVLHNKQRIPSEAERDQLAHGLNQLLGLQADLRTAQKAPSARIALSIAIYRNSVPERVSRR